MRYFCNYCGYCEAAVDGSECLICDCPEPIRGSGHTLISASNEAENEDTSA